MNKPFVALLCALTALATVNFVVASGPAIMRVFVTNWPSNQNVTVTNPQAPPTVNLNITTGKPALDKRVDGAVQAVTSSTTVRPGNIRFFRSQGNSWYAQIYDQTPSNFTFDVRGYRTIVVGTGVVLGPQLNGLGPGGSIINQSQPLNVTKTVPWCYYQANYGWYCQGNQTAISTTVTYYNYSYTYSFVAYTSGPIAGQPNSPAQDVRYLPYCGQRTSDGAAIGTPCYNYGFDQATGSQTYIIDGASALGPNLTIHIYYYRLVAMGLYYDGCAPWAAYSPQNCYPYLTNDQSLPYALLSGSTNATATVYATE